MIIDVIYSLLVTSTAFIWQGNLTFPLVTESSLLITLIIGKRKQEIDSFSFFILMLCSTEKSEKNK
ncbi:hypothetical protein B0X71_09985 [Planococcus lenghuensis]|uniref:Uncharacterized protein n=1 Tax=Planococcus lenghuensis TaxID=2213202 RepID=A0A1Q2L0F1_9BACL|nr:hypothetical protein B0X71_09985 [Planococcus lenghuensis]